MNLDKTIYGLRFAQLLLNNEDENGNTETNINIIYERLYEDGINAEGINEAYIIYKNINYIDCYKFYYYAKCNSNFEKNSNNDNNGNDNDNDNKNKDNYNAYYMDWILIEKEKLFEIFINNLKLH